MACCPNSTRTASLLRARAVSRRASPSLIPLAPVRIVVLLPAVALAIPGLPTTTSTASSRAPTAVVHEAEVQPDSGGPIIASRSRSIPASAAASALIAGMPTMAVQAPLADGPPSTASSSETELVMAMVLPRRRPSGNIDSRPGCSGSGGRQGLASVAMGPAGEARSSVLKEGCRCELALSGLWE